MEPLVHTGPEGALGSGRSPVFVAGPYTKAFSSGRSCVCYREIAYRGKSLMHDAAPEEPVFLYYIPFYKHAAPAGAGCALAGFPFCSQHSDTLQVPPDGGRVQGGLICYKQVAPKGA